MNPSWKILTYKSPQKINSSAKPMKYNPNKATSPKSQHPQGNQKMFIKTCISRVTGQKFYNINQYKNAKRNLQIVNEQAGNLIDQSNIHCIDDKTFEISQMSGHFKQQKSQKIINGISPIAKHKKSYIFDKKQQPTKYRLLSMISDTEIQLIKLKNQTLQKMNKQISRVQSLKDYIETISEEKLAQSVKTNILIQSNIQSSINEFLKKLEDFGGVNEGKRQIKQNPQKGFLLIQSKSAKAENSKKSEYSNFFQNINKIPTKTARS